jgi:hypothetical protein
MQTGLVIISFLLYFVSVGWTQTKINICVPKAGTVDVTRNQDMRGAYVHPMELPLPDGEGEKAQLAQLKLQMELNFPRKNEAVSAVKSDSITHIQSFTGFEGNIFQNGAPNDNTLAISNGGLLISAINSNYYVYNTNTNELLFNNFLSTLLPPPVGFASKYDPKLTYDPEMDRFIMVFLIGSSYQTSQIAVCFSSSNDPLEPWHVYKLSGNPLGSNHWTDYPAIAVGTNDLFLTGNLLTNNSSWQTGFQQSLIWQIDKMSGYNGDANLEMTLWSGITDGSVKIRNIHPAKGATKLAGPNQYFLSTKNFSPESDTLYLLEITDSHLSGNAELNITRLSNPNHYFMSPNGRQSISKTLATNDSRVLGAIIDEDVIQYVHNCMDTATGNAGIYHGRVVNYHTAPIASGKILGHPVLDLGYPNIASTGIQSNDLSCVIGFNFTSPLDTNGIAALFMDNEGNYSPYTRLKTGDAPISIVSGAVDRWGDYFGIQRNFVRSCEVWVAGMFGKVGANGTWISKIDVGEPCEVYPYLANVDEKYEEVSLTIFPNPVWDRAYVDFSLEKGEIIRVTLYDLQGKVIGEVYEDYVKKGANRISFGISDLPNGMYIISFSTTEEQLFSKQFIVQR